MAFIFLLSLISFAFGFVEIANKQYDHMPDEYIITYHTNTTVQQAFAHWDLLESKGMSFIHKYNAGSHKGFAARITDESILAALQNHPMISDIEMNGFAYANQEPCNAKQQPVPSWGLARYSHEGDVSRGLLMEMDYRSQSQGAGVQIFIVDTGIHVTHVDFAGRARWGVAYADGGSQVDGNGHGTHCAGTAAGTTYGIAKAAQLVAVKVLGASGGGTWADVIAGVNYCTNNGDSGKAVVSMSLGGAGSNAGLTNAINACVDSGIPVIVAAGNSNGNACSYTPSGIPSVVSVGASEIAGFEPAEFDNRASFSNYGTCTHIWAPGRDITSAWIGSNTAANTISGTSMACPHVAGYTAVLLGANTSPFDIKSTLQQHSQKDLIENIGAGSPNFLLHNQCPQS